MSEEVKLCNCVETTLIPAACCRLCVYDSQGAADSVPGDEQTLNVAARISFLLLFINPILLPSCELPVIC